MFDDVYSVNIQHVIWKSKIRNDIVLLKLNFNYKIIIIIQIVLTYQSTR